MSKKIVLSGIQPTGSLHIGNYLGSIKNFLELQDKYSCYFFIADYHSLTGDFEPKEKYNQIIDLAIDYIALGLDPKKCVIFAQSDVPECAELSWIFNTLTPMAELERMTQYKDKALRQKQNVNAGLFDYPVLQAADILLYHTDLVPVGQDQVQHVEFTRKIARYFNNKFGNYFKEPEALLTSVPKVMSLIEPDKKMSKSHGEKSCIGINDSPQAIKDKLSKAVTGTGKEKVIPAGGKNLLMLMEEFGTPDEIKYFNEQAKKHDIRYGELKSSLFNAISAYFEQYRSTRKELEKDRKLVERVLKDGAQKASKVAKKTMSEVKSMIFVK